MLPLDYIERSIPVLADLLSSYGIDVVGLRTSIENAALSTSRYVATQAFAFGQDAVVFGLLCGLMLYWLFFFVRGWERILDAIVRVFPLGDDREQCLAVDRIRTPSVDRRHRPSDSTQAAPPDHYLSKMLT